MKMFRLFNVCFILSMLGKDVQSQIIKPLTIGDNVPDLQINNVINYPRSSFKVSDFKGKLLILDFWATWCSPCVASLPKLEVLQKKFGDKIQILPVTTEDQKTVSIFLEKMRNIKNILPTSVTADRTLIKLFKHTYVPHCVWIDGAGKVVAITDETNVTEDNIEKLLEGNNISMPLKNDIENRIVQQSGKPVYFISHSVKGKNGAIEVTATPESSIMVNSILTRYTEGLPSVTNNSDSARFSALNTSIYWLYRQALWQFGLEILNSNRTIIDIANPDLINKLTDSSTTRENGDAWVRNNGFSYELKVNAAMAREKFKVMLSELNHYFGALYGIEGVMEKRSQKYLALVRTSKEDKLASKGGKTVVQKNKFWFRMQNAEIVLFVAEMMQPMQFYPFVEDETDYKGRVDIEINASLSDLKSVNKELERYGLQFIEKQKVADIAVIRMKQKL